MERLSPEVFTWSRWRQCSIFELIRAPWTEQYIIKSRKIIIQFAVGWIEGERLVVRPKSNHRAVMFFIEGEHQWCHITNKEFGAIFGKTSE